MSYQKQLFGLDKNGGYKSWLISAVGDEILISHGKEGGKQQLKREVIEGKNIGRSNETTPAQQAELEAISRVNKQIDKGYRENKAELEELPLLPMLAVDYHKQGHRIKFPCLVSPKMDGVRCIAYSPEHSQEVVLLSRGGKEYDVPHLKEFLKVYTWDFPPIDGEIYIHRKFLEEITSAVKKPNELTPELEFIAFDVVTDKPFHERMKILKDLKNTWLKVLDYEVCTSEEHMKELHKKYVEQGYEGIMLRNMEGKYESGKRSADLQKYKEFMDDEFKILAVVEDRNGNAVFTVKNKFAENIFNVAYGDFDQRKHFLEDADNLIGKMITVKYQTLYKDTLIPQFPVGINIRDYE